VGIIGRNGAGKSTLLKIMSRVTAPTSGQVKVKGRIASLLEVGTGFHPELTGRENIYLNGSILGMKKAEIGSKFDEIVAFAELDKFIDTPVKRYSSGMYVRLAFAVAGHLESEILLIDEVLAVGDVSFQKKCINKMSDAASEGRTVLFVSHNLPAIVRLCSRALLLDEGGIQVDGQVHVVTNLYLKTSRQVKSECVWLDLNNAPGDDIVRLRKVCVRSEDLNKIDSVEIRSPVGIEIVFDVLQPGYFLTPNFHFFNEEGVCLFVSVELDPTWGQRKRPVGRFTSTAWVPGNFFAEGTFQVGVAVSTFEPWRIHFYERDIVSFQVVDKMEDGSARGNFHGHLPGVVRPSLRWITQFDPITTDSKL
jgi:lipopolysaccharide transport system ATP-binding protein